jgi:hypothetical protein
MLGRGYGNYLLDKPIEVLLRQDLIIPIEQGDPSLARYGIGVTPRSTIYRGTELYFAVRDADDLIVGAENGKSTKLLYAFNEVDDRRLQALYDALFERICGGFGNPEHTKDTPNGYLVALWKILDGNLIIEKIHQAVIVNFTSSLIEQHGVFAEQARQQLDVWSRSRPKRGFSRFLLKWIVFPFVLLFLVQLALVAMGLMR